MRRPASAHELWGGVQRSGPSALLTTVEWWCSTKGWIWDCICGQRGAYVQLLVIRPCHQRNRQSLSVQLLLLQGTPL